jgi:hypothetical protein
MHFLHTYGQKFKTNLLLRTKSKTNHNNFTMEPVKPTNNISKKVVCTDESAWSALVESKITFVFS